MGRYQREKGKRIEREAVKACQELVFSPSTARRSQQSDGKDDPDVRDILPGFRVEVKGRAKHACLRHMSKLSDELTDGQVPLVLLREDQLEDVGALSTAYNTNLRNHIARHAESSSD